MHKPRKSTESKLCLRLKKEKLGSVLLPLSYRRGWGKIGNAYSPLLFLSHKEEILLLKTETVKENKFRIKL